MSDEFSDIPADMNDADAARQLGAKAVVSVRDYLILSGASDEELRELDEREEILEREPWRRGKFRPFGDSDFLSGDFGGMRFGTTTPTDWTGTKFEKPKTGDP